MNWFRKLMVKYEDWRVKTEKGVIHDLVTIQVESIMKSRGVLVVKDEK